MNHFLKNSILFLTGLTLLLIVVVYLFSYSIARQNFSQSNAESNLLIIENGNSYDYLMLGNSHARNFSRHGNHQRVSEIWEKEFLNLGQGLGICGSNDQLLYFKYALQKNISFDKLIYTISPPFLYGAHLNETSKTFFQEPLQLDFLWAAIKHKAPNKINRLHNYFRSKCRPNWLKFKPNTNTSKDDKLSQIDSSSFAKGFALAYPFGREESYFQESTAHLEATIDLANEKNAEIILITTPALFGHWPGQERVARYCDSLINLPKKNIKYYDLSLAIKDPALFYDHHHLNSNGIDSLAILLRELGL